MKKVILKPIALILSLVLCATSSGCFGLSDGGNSSSNSTGISKSILSKDETYNKIDNIDVSTPYSPVTLDYGYYALETEAQKQMYKEFERVVGSVSNEADDDGLYPMEIIELKDINLSEGNIRIVIEAFNCDHPEIFWVSNVFGYYSDDSVTVVHLYSEFSSDEINSMQKELDTAVNIFLSEVPKDLSEYRRERFIHDKMLENCSYADNVKSSKDNPNAFTMYGVLIENSAVCEGYTRAMQYLLKMVGIKTITVNGYSKNELHQWCLVNIDDNWYHLDATWNDKDSEDGEEDNILYTYFNTTDSFIVADHTIAKKYTILTEEELCGMDDESLEIFNLPLPQCISEEACIYSVDGAVLTAIDNYDCYNNIVTKLYEAVLLKEDYFYLKVSDDLNYDDMVDQLFYKEPYQFFEYTNDVNKMLDTDYKISDSLSVLTLDEQKIIEVQLAYE